MGFQQKVSNESLSHFHSQVEYPPSLSRAHRALRFRFAFLSNRSAMRSPHQEERIALDRG